MQPDRRDEVLDIAQAKGWMLDSKRTEHGAISDKFVRADLSMILFWVETPWSDARSAGWRPADGVKADERGFLL